MSGRRLLTWPLPGGGLAGSMQCEHGRTQAARFPHMGAATSAAIVADLARRHTADHGCTCAARAKVAARRGPPGREVE